MLRRDHYENNKCEKVQAINERNVRISSYIALQDTKIPKENIMEIIDPEMKIYASEGHDQNTKYKHAQMTSNTSDTEMKINIDIIEDTISSIYVKVHKLFLYTI